MKLLDRPDRFFAVASLVLGLVLTVVTPPFQVPDEPAHFYRAYLVSEGRLRLVAPGTNREELPASLPHLTETLLGDSPFPSERRIAPRAILDAFAVPLGPTERIPVYAPSSLQYTFVPYVAQALGVGVGRLLGAPPLALLYAARLANLVAGTVAIWGALRLLPGLRWPVVLLALMPMTLALRASASADTTTISAAFLFTAAAARLIWGSDRPRRLHLAVLATAAAVLCAAKPPYAPLALLVVLVPRVRWPAKRRFAFLASYFVVLGAISGWSVATARAVGNVRPGAGVDADLQIAGILADPFSLLRVIVADYAVHTARYLAHFVGHLGWLDVRPPVWLLVAYLAVLLAVTLIDREGGVAVSPRQRVVVAAVVAAGMVLISASQYISFTPVGAALVDGLQGRYYIPLAAAGMWVLRGGPFAPRSVARAVPAVVAVAVLLGFALAVRALVERFYAI